MTENIVPTENVNDLDDETNIRTKRVVHPVERLMQT